MAINAADLLVNVRADVDDAKRKIKDVDRELKGLGGTFDFVGKAAKGFGIAAVAGFSALGTQAVAGSVLQLTAAIAPMVGLFAALPGAAAVAGAAFGTLALGMVGVGEAFKQLIAGDMKKFEEALKNLAPSAVEFFRALQRAGPAFKALRMDVQNTLFQGLGFHVSRLARVYLPALRGPMVEIARQFNLAARGVADFLARADNVMDVRSIFVNTGKAMEPLRRILLNLTAGLLDFATVGAGLMPGFMRSVEGLTERFREWADEARRSGAIEAWIRAGAEAAKDFGGILLNVGSIIKTILSAVPAGGLLQHLKEITQAAEDFLKSAEGQTSLRDMFASLEFAASAVGPAIKALITMVTQGLMPVLANLAVGVGPGVVVFLDALKEALKTLAPSAMILGVAVGELLKNLAPLLPVVADLLATMIKWAAPLIANETFARALLAAFVGFKAISGIMGVANGAIAFFTSAAVKGFAKVVVAISTWIASMVAAAARMVVLGAQVVAVALWMTAQVIAQYVRQAAAAVLNMARVEAALLLANVKAAAVAVASMVTTAAKIIASWVVMAAGATLNAAKIVAAWVLHTATAGAAAVARMAAAAALIVAKWAWMAAQAAANAVRMAAAWIVAMGPVAWVTAAVIGLAVLIIANWGRISAATSAAWSAISATVRNAWQAILSAVASAVAQVVAKAVALKGQIVSAFSGLPAAMAAAGRAAMNGLANGIADAGRRAINKAREMAASVKREVEEFFKIGSPSKVFHEIGVWTGEGLANGLKAMEGAVARAGAGMAAAAVPDVARGTGLAPTPSALTGGADRAGGAVSVAPGAVQLIIQGNVSEATLPQVQSSVDDAFRALLAEINSGRIPGRVA